MSCQSATDYQLTSRFIKTDVTAIKILSHFIFAGIGNVLHVFNVTDKKCQFFLALHKQRIHGIRFNAESNLIVVYGNREIAVASFSIADNKVDLTILSRWIVGDWICDVKWSKGADELIILTANNIVSVWNWEGKVLRRSVKCHDKCLLFCGIILGTDWSDAIVMCGTMFRSILIWAPPKATGDTCGILHKLTGHKGAIFSVFYHEKSRRICSTSDDRSARIWLVNFPSETVPTLEAWSKATIIPLFSVYGHMSRVWKAFIFDDSRFVSAGEDSQLRVWSKSGKPLFTWETHQGASIRSLDVCEKLNVIVTGGKDGGISLWPVQVDNQSLEVAFGDELNFRHSRDVPRRLLLSKCGDLLTTTNEGKLLAHSKTVWQYVHSDPRFASYCLFEISPSKTYFSWASLKGDVKIFEETKDESFVTVIFEGRICTGKIFSLHWLTDLRFITCCTDGQLEVWDLNLHFDHNNVSKVGEYILPSCKERWLTSAVEFQNQIIVGDREGSIHVFSGDRVPRQTFRRIHGRLGVSGISFSNSCEFYSIGRDGFIRYWRNDGSIVEHMAADKLPVKWPVRVLTSPAYGLLVLGFNETNFEVWNVKERKQLFTFKCGGGHRPWDFVIDERAQFVYIREKTVCCVLLPLNQLMKPSYLEGFHIRDTVCIRYLNEDFIISGGEDTTLRLSRVFPETRMCKPVTIVRSHISSIRTITFTKVDDFILVVSAGGRAQLKVWKLITAEGTIKYSELASHMLKPSNKSRKPWINMIHTFELEPRHMDLQIERSSQTDFRIYAAGSDAFWRIYTFSLTTKSLQLCEEIEYPNYCILKLLLVEWHDRKFIVTLATDGRATFWDTNYSVTYQQAVHQSGINSCDYVMVGEHLVLVTGGDDTSLVATSFESSGEVIKMTSQWRNASVHEAQISGIRVVGNHIISVGADQKVVLWQWELTRETIRVDLKSFQHSFVPDIHGLDISPSGKYVCVFGAGFEVFSMDL